MFATASTPSGKDPWIGIGVSLAGWISCLLSPTMAISALLLAHLAALAVDQWIQPRGVMGWMIALRMRLSVGAIVAHIVALVL